MTGPNDAHKKKTAALPGRESQLDRRRVFDFAPRLLRSPGDFCGWRNSLDSRSSGIGE
jgi:hypothetical protein